ncbi:MAG: ROK family glucokinase [Oscillospiraceae bacterium]|nr:ROK family glucokinase [Oscillospiraceae bacterium]MCL2278501.1 ROK family glucokinase [Oscillospiraceae bacterium]
MKYYVGIDLGGTNIVAGVVDENYKIIAKYSEPTNASRTFEEVCASIANAAFEATKKANLDMGDIEAVGVGSPGCVNRKTNLLVFSNNLGWENVPFQDELEKHFAMPVYIENDANCAALGEVLVGAARDYENACMITLGTGVGGGIIIDKKIFSGSDRLGAEIGHTTLLYGGEICSCGLKGCFEAYASATALIRQIKQAIKQHPESLLNKLCEGNLDKVEAKTAFDAMDKGDDVAIKVVDQYISYVAAGVGSMMSLFRPEVVIVGGGVSNAGDKLMKPLTEKTKHLTFTRNQAENPPIVLAELGNDAGIIGAAMLAKM